MASHNVRAAIGHTAWVRAALEQEDMVRAGLALAMLELALLSEQQAQDEAVWADYMNQAAAIRQMQTKTQEAKACRLESQARAIGEGIDKTQDAIAEKQAVLASWGLPVESENVPAGES